MTLRAIIFLTFSTTLTSCNFFSENEIKERVDEGIQMSNERMSSDIARAKEEFITLYKKGSFNLVDSIWCKNFLRQLTKQQLILTH